MNLFLGDVTLSCLPWDPRYAGSNPAESDGFVRAVQSVTGLPSEGKQGRRPHLIQFYVVLKNVTGMKEILVAKISSYLSPSFSRRCYYLSLLQPEQRTLVDELGVITAQT
jgi:hypothetical protein